MVIGHERRAFALRRHFQRGLEGDRIVQQRLVERQNALGQRRLDAAVRVRQGLLFLQDGLAQAKCDDSVSIDEAFSQLKTEI